MYCVLTERRENLIILLRVKAVPYTELGAVLLILGNIHAVDVNTVIELQSSLALIPIHAERGRIAACAVALKVR